MVIATILTLMLRRLSPDVTFVVYFASVALAAWYGGLGPGLLSAVISAVISDFLFLDPVNHLSLGVSEVVRLVSFLSAAGLTSYLVSTRAQARSALRATEHTFRLLVDSVKDYAIFLLDPQGHVRSWNAGAENLKGYRPEEIIGQHFSRFYTPEDVADGLPSRALQTALTEGRFRNEGWRVRSDGRRFWADVLITPLRDERGQHLGFAKVTRDLTERKRAEDEVRALNADLERRVVERTAELSATNRQLEAFTYSVSHDLRAPLRGVRGFADILARRYRALLPEEGQRYLDNVVEAGTRMEHLIDDLLQYARLGRGSLELGPVPLEEVLDRIVRDLAPRLDGGQVEVAPSLPVVRGDRSLLQQVFGNLVTNAITYHRPRVPPQVRVEASVDGSTAVVRVRDNGLGIPPQHHERIFNLFQRLQSTEDFPGTGVGLSIVRKALDLLGGDIWLESQVGQGTTFFVRLPLAGVDGVAPAAEGRRAPTPEKARP